MPESVKCVPSWMKPKSKFNPRTIYHLVLKDRKAFLLMNSGAVA